MSFGDAAQIFHIGPASCGVYGTPAGVCAAIERWGSIPLAELAAPAARLAREGVELNAGQAYIAKILTDLLTSTPECAALWAPAGHVLREGELLRNPELGDALALLGEEGAEPFYRGEIAAAVCDWMSARGAALSSENLAGYRAVAREPVRVRYRDREVLTNPPPSAGGTLLAYALALLDRGPAPPGLGDVVAAMGAAQDERTAEFVEGLGDEGFLERFLARRLGSTTHISVLDSDGRACSVTCSNGEGSGVVVPGTGIHLNNVMGEQDLNPLGFHRHPAGRRMPSMMAPTVVMRDVADRERSSWCSAAPAPTASARRCSRRSSASSTTGSARVRRWRLRACTSRTGRCLPSRGSISSASRVRSSSFTTSTCSSAASRRCSAATGRSRGRVIPGAGVWR